MHKFILPLFYLGGFLISAHATIFVQESFLTTDYTADTNVVGQNGGTGFSGNWSSGDVFAPTVRFDTRSTGLSYSGWSNEGGSLEHYRTNSSSFTKTITHNLNYSAPTISGSDVAYFGFLFNATAGVRFDLSWNGTSSRNNVFTYAGNTTEEMVFNGGGSASTELRVAAAAGQDHLVLLRISDNTTYDFEEYYDNIEMWVDPDLSNLGVADDTGRGIFSKFGGGNTDLAADDWSITATLTEGQSFKVDELFFSNDLIAIPEPSSALLFLTGVAVSLISLRRKR